MVHEMGSALLLTILAPFPSNSESPPLSPSTSRTLFIFPGDHLTLLSLGTPMGLCSYTLEALRTYSPTRDLRLLILCPKNIIPLLPCRLLSFCLSALRDPHTEHSALRWISVSTLSSSFLPSAPYSLC